MGKEVVEDGWNPSLLGIAFFRGLLLLVLGSVYLNGC